MKIVNVQPVVERGSFSQSAEWAEIRKTIHEAIERITWPPDGERGQFVIYPESGKKSGEGNGVGPIKVTFIEELSAQGWEEEYSFQHDTDRERHVKALDVVLKAEGGSVGVEWETGNISSSHRALNKMCLGILYGYLRVGVLVVPSGPLAKYLTDRIGNLRELRPYLNLWRAALQDESIEGVLEIVEVQHNAESLDVPKILKLSSGNAALGEREKAATAAIRAAADAQKRRREEALASAMEPLNAVHQQAKEELLSRQETEKEQLLAAQVREIEDRKAARTGGLDELRAAHSTARRELRAAHASERQQLRAAHDQEIRQWKAHRITDVEDDSGENDGDQTIPPP